MLRSRLRPAWAGPANWKTVKPTVTTNIVYATVPHITNPSAEASPNPGTPGGIQPPLPNSGPAGTMDMHLDVYQVPSGKPTPVVIQIHGGGWIRGDRPSGSGGFGPFFAAGMSVVAVQYRNAIGAPAPAAVEDVLCAMARVKANAAKYNFDVEPGRPEERACRRSPRADDRLCAGLRSDPPGCTDQPKVVAVIDMYGASDVAESLTFHGSMDFTHQWIGLDLPRCLPDPAPPLQLLLPLQARPLAAASTTPANLGDGMPRPCRQAPRWGEPTQLCWTAREKSIAADLHSSRPAAHLHHQRRPRQHLQSLAVV